MNIRRLVTGPGGLSWSPIVILLMLIASPIRLSGSGADDKEVGGHVGFGFPLVTKDGDNVSSLADNFQISFSEQRTFLRQCRIAMMGIAMADVRSELPPVSDVVTDFIRVQVVSQHSAENSRPDQGVWVFQYTVRITNQGDETVQLVSRHWIITDGVGDTEEVRGPGVVGEQPVLEQGRAFQYSSWCPLKTPMGVMRGTYQMVSADGRKFDIEIAPFALKARYTIN